MEILNIEKYNEKFFSYIQLVIEKNLYCTVQAGCRLKNIQLFYDKKGNANLFEFGIKDNIPYMEFWKGYTIPDNKESFFRKEGWDFTQINKYFDNCLSISLDDREECLSIAWWLYCNGYGYEFSQRNEITQFYIKGGNFTVKENKIYLISDKQEKVLTKEAFYSFVEGIYNEWE